MANLNQIWLVLSLCGPHSIWSPLLNIVEHRTLWVNVANAFSETTDLMEPKLYLDDYLKVLQSVCVFQSENQVNQYCSTKVTLYYMGKCNKYLLRKCCTDEAQTVHNDQCMMLSNVCVFYVKRQNWYGFSCCSYFNIEHYDKKV